MQKSFLFTSVVIFAFVATPFVLPILNLSSEINCTHEEINIKTGKAKFSRYFWYIKISEKLEDTFFSDILEGEVINIADISSWHYVNSFSFMSSSSPHYRFHGAFSQIYTTKKSFAFQEIQKRKIDLDAKKNVVRTVLMLWQRKGKDYGANEYIDTLYTD